MENGIDILIAQHRNLKWMISDQAYDFDDCLRMPVIDRNRFSRAIARYLEHRESVPPETMLATVLERLRCELEEIARGGEDLDRLGRWLLSMLDTDQKPDRYRRARDSWGEGFNYWRENGLPSVTLSKYPLAIECISSYAHEVFLPYWEFRERSEKSEKNWMEGRDNRSPVDKVLFEVFYEEANCSPINDFHSLYSVILKRIWFEKAQSAYSEELFEELYELLVPLAYSGEHLFTDPSYVQLAPLHEAFALNEGCSFSENCRANIDTKDTELGI